LKNAVIRTEEKAGGENTSSSVKRRFSVTPNQVLGIPFLRGKKMFFVPENVTETFCYENPSPGKLSEKTTLLSFGLSIACRAK
jgi:hypothetical protein